MLVLHNYTILLVVNLIMYQLNSPSANTLVWIVVEPILVVKSLST